MSLPALNDIQYTTSADAPYLASALSTLFEHSPILAIKLEPELSRKLKPLPPLSSYAQLIDIALETIDGWDVGAQSEFISGHPRIGESKNLSNLSAREQGSNPTPPEVLARLEHLNACYEKTYPGLHYITFEMEGKLELEHSLSPDEPVIDVLVPVEVSSETWRSELKRAIKDVGRIAKSRLSAFGVE
ncbi:Oxo-4-hydroxy-4-carboxy-5-ureidoimidazoline decarboxylase [Cyathus striatus]|nr:Oxo-4-hydroxy-4-carboxy-5-ureidoimidazoline decarboxylase [Cyathus striatus]